MPVESAPKAIRKTFQVARLARCFIKSAGVWEFKVREFLVQEFKVREFKVPEFLVRSAGVLSAGVLSSKLVLFQWLRRSRWLIIINPVNPNNPVHPRPIKSA